MRAVIASRKGDERAIVAALTEVAKLIDALSPTWLAGREQLLMLGALASHGLGNLEKARGYLNHVLVRNCHGLRNPSRLSDNVSAEKSSNGMRRVVRVLRR